MNNTFYTYFQIKLIFFSATLKGQYEARTIFQTLDKAWDLLRIFPQDKLKKIKQSTKDLYYAKRGDDGDN